MGMRKFAIYFKINLCKLVKKQDRLKNSTLSDNYLKNNCKKIRSVCKKKKN